MLSHFPIPKCLKSVVAFCVASQIADCTLTPIDCVGDWLPWDRCSQSCLDTDGNNSTPMREHVFSVAVPALYGGVECSFEDNEVGAGACNTQPCPIDCVGVWRPWDTCSRTCAGGVQFREFDLSVDAEFGGVGCDTANNTREQQFCNEHRCPIDATCDWSVWGACSHCLDALCLCMFLFLIVVLS